MQQTQQQAPQQQAPQAPQQMANGDGTQGFDPQETMQGEGGVAQPQQETTETPTQSTDAPVMEQGGEVKQDEGLDWGLVFTFFNFRDE